MIIIYCGRVGMCEPSELPALFISPAMAMAKGVVHL